MNVYNLNCLGCNTSPDGKKVILVVNLPEPLTSKALTALVCPICETNSFTLTHLSAPLGEPHGSSYH